MSNIFDFIIPGVGERLEENGYPVKIPDGKFTFVQQAYLRDTETDPAVKLRTRRQTEIVSEATAYGRKHQINAWLREHSPSGISKKYVNADGTLSFDEIHSDIKKSVTNDTARLTRMNNIAVMFTTSDTYENYTQLFFSMLSLAWTIFMCEKTTVHNVKVYLNQGDYGDEEFDLERFRALLREHIGDKVGLPKKFDPTQIITWEDFKTKCALTNKNKRDITVRCWKAPEYDDGHIEINENRFTKAGFVKGLFLAGKHWMRPIGMNKFKAQEAAMYDDTSVIAAFDDKYFIRGEGMSQKDFAIMYLALFERRRNTPFLCDQDVNIADGLVRVVGTTTQNIGDMEDTIYDVGERLTIEDVFASFHKFVSLHRAYDDAVVAVKLFSNYVAQHNPDTVEAHTWFDMEWETKMPSLGMRRGALAMLLAEDAALISVQSTKMMVAMRGHMQSMIAVSAIKNALWSWGEYLYTMIDAEVIKGLQSVISGKMRPYDYQNWQASILSGMLATAQPVALFKNTGTLLRFQNDRLFDVERTIINKVKDSASNLRMNGDLEVIPNGQVISWKRLVPPSGQEMILGMPGDLVKHTPYAPTFSFTKPMRAESLRSWSYSIGYMDLWKMSTLARWCGYDVWYTDGSNTRDENAYVMYAANDISLAPPPIFDTEARTLHRHEIIRVLQRPNHFGTNPWDAVHGNVVKTLNWNVFKMSMTVDGDRRGAYSGSTALVPKQGTSMFETLELEQQYIATVAVSYDFVEADFHVTKTMIGDTRPEERAALPPDESTASPLVLGVGGEEAEHATE